MITAVERLERGRLVTRGRVVAGLSFGFWALDGSTQPHESGLPSAPMRFGSRDECRNQPTGGPLGDGLSIPISALGAFETQKDKTVLATLSSDI